MYFFNNKKSKEKDFEQSGTKQEENYLQYFFSYSGDGSLWLKNSLVDDENLKEMGLSENTIKKSKELAKDFQNSIDWNNGKNKWNTNEWSIFIKETNDLYYRIKKEIGNNFSVINLGYRKIIESKYDGFIYLYYPGNQYKAPSVSVLNRNIENDWLLFNFFAENEPRLFYYEIKKILEDPNNCADKGCYGNELGVEFDKENVKIIDILEVDGEECIINTYMFKLLFDEYCEIRETLIKQYEYSFVDSIFMI